jgi:hypothetical protein
VKRGAHFATGVKLCVKRPECTQFHHLLNCERLEHVIVMCCRYYHKRFFEGKSDAEAKSTSVYSYHASSHCCNAMLQFFYLGRIEGAHAHALWLMRCTPAAADMALAAAVKQYDAGTQGQIGQIGRREGVPLIVRGGQGRSGSCTAMPWCMHASLAGAPDC